MSFDACALSAATMNVMCSYYELSDLPLESCFATVLYTEYFIKKSRYTWTVYGVKALVPPSGNGAELNPPATEFQNIYFLRGLIPPHASAGIAACCQDSAPCLVARSSFVLWVTQLVAGCTGARARRLNFTLSVSTMYFFATVAQSCNAWAHASSELWTWLHARVHGSNIHK